MVVCRNKYTLDTVRGTPERDSNEFLGRLVAFHPSVGSFPSCTWLPGTWVPRYLKTARNGRLAD